MKDLYNNSIIITVMVATMTITVKICYDVKSNVIINRFIKHRKATKVI